MSIEIIYGRQIVRTTRGLIPLFLHGSSNCTMLVGSREVRERYWSPMSFHLEEVPESELLENIEHYRTEDADREICRISGRGNVCGAEWYRYLVNGVKAAKTIEEIVELANAPLRCSISYAIDDASSSSWFYTWKRDACATIRDTPSLEKWMDEATARKAEIASDKTTKYVSLVAEFDSLKPLGIDRIKQDIKGPVVAKLGKLYVGDYGPHKVMFANSIQEAMEFDSVDYARSVLPPMPRCTYSFTKATRKKDDALKKWVLKVENGSRKGFYIKKLNSRSMEFCRDPISAKRFKSEADANEWFTEKRIAFRYETACNVASVAKIAE